MWTVEVQKRKGDVAELYFKQSFQKLDLARLVKELNEAYWAKAVGNEEEGDAA